MYHAVTGNALKRMGAILGIDSLTVREKWVLLGGLIFVLCFLALQLAILPALDARTSLIRSLERKKQELVKIRELQQEYRYLKKAEGDLHTRIGARDPDFALFTFIDRQADTARVKKHISYIKPSTGTAGQPLHETSVELKLQELSLESLVRFLLLVESEKEVVFVRRISIQENGSGQGYLDAILQIVTFEKRT